MTIKVLILAFHLFNTHYHNPKDAPIFIIENISVAIQEANCKINYLNEQESCRSFCNTVIYVDYLDHVFIDHPECIEHEESMAAIASTFTSNN